MFSFGFSGDDIEADETDLQSGLDQGSSSSAVAQVKDSALPELVPAQRHEISEWVSVSPLCGFISEPNRLSSAVHDVYMYLPKGIAWDISSSSWEIS